MADRDERTGTLSGLTEAEAREFHQIFMTSFVIFTIIAIAAHVLVWMWRPLVAGPERVLGTADRGASRRNFWPRIISHRGNRHVENMDVVRPAPCIGGAGNLPFRPCVTDSLHPVEHKSLQLDRRAEADESFCRNNQHGLRVSRAARKSCAIDCE